MTFRSSAVLHHPSLVLLFPLIKTRIHYKKGSYEQRERKQSLLCVWTAVQFNAVTVKALLFSPCYWLSMANIPSMRQGEKKGNVEIITVTGTGEGFHLALFWVSSCLFTQLAVTGLWAQTSYRWRVTNSYERQEMCCWSYLCSAFIHWQDCRCVCVVSFSH